MVENNISQYDAKKKYSEDRIYFRYKEELLNEPNPIGDVLCVGSEYNIAMFRRTHEKEQGYIHGVIHGIDWINPLRGAQIIRLKRKII